MTAAAAPGVSPCPGLNARFGSRWTHGAQLAPWNGSKNSCIADLRVASAAGKGRVFFHPALQETGVDLPSR